MGDLDGEDAVVLLLSGVMLLSISALLGFVQERHRGAESAERSALDVVRCQILPITTRWRERGCARVAAWLSVVVRTTIWPLRTARRTVSP